MKRLDGRQVLKYSYDLFTYERAVMDIPKEYVFFFPYTLYYLFNDVDRTEQFLGIRYPPYTDEKFDFLSAAAKLPIPKFEEL